MRIFYLAAALLWSFYFWRDLDKGRYLLSLLDLIFTVGMIVAAMRKDKDMNPLLSTFVNLLFMGISIFALNYYWDQEKEGTTTILYLWAFSLGTNFVALLINLNVLVKGVSQ